VSVEDGEIGDERHEVDHRLGRQAGHGGRTDVMDVGARQRRQPLDLRREPRRPAVVVSDDQTGESRPP
jgi:hypothetical protein